MWRSLFGAAEDRNEWFAPDEIPRDEWRSPFRTAEDRNRLALAKGLSVAQVAVVLPDGRGSELLKGPRNRGPGLVAVVFLLTAENRKGKGMGMAARQIGMAVVLRDGRGARQQGSGTDAC